MLEGHESFAFHPSSAVAKTVGCSNQNLAIFCSGKCFWILKYSPLTTGCKGLSRLSSCSYSVHRLHFDARRESLASRSLHCLLLGPIPKEEGQSEHLRMAIVSEPIPVMYLTDLNEQRGGPIFAIHKRTDVLAFASYCSTFRASVWFGMCVSCRLHQSRKCEEREIFHSTLRSVSLPLSLDKQRKGK